MNAIKRSIAKPEEKERKKSNPTALSIKQEESLMPLVNINTQASSTLIYSK